MLRRLIFRVQNQFFYTIGLIIFVTFFVLTLWGNNGVLRLVELRRIRANVAGENHELLKQNLLYAQEIERLRQMRYLEQRARSDLGFVKENETVFIIPEKK